MYVGAERVSPISWTGKWSYQLSKSICKEQFKIWYETRKTTFDLDVITCVIC